MEAPAEFEFGDPVTEANIHIVERKVFVRVKKTISVLEDAISKWNGTKAKPKELKPKFLRYKRLHDDLSQWGKGLVTAKKKKMTFQERVARLHQFVDICHTDT